MKLLSVFKNLFSKSDSTKNFYLILGGEEGLRELVKNFYDVMENDPNAKNCLNIHDLNEGFVKPESKERLFMFLSGWLGGPNLFVENVGAPRMRMRHAHVKISERERLEWLYCMKQALKRKKIGNSDKKTFLRSLEALSYRIKNN